MKKRMLFIADMQYRAEELKGLKEQRADLVEQMRALAGRAETEKRAMSDEEKTEFDGLEEQIRALDETMERLKKAKEAKETEGGDDDKGGCGGRSVEDAETRAF